MWCTTWFKNICQCVIVELSGCWQINLVMSLQTGRNGSNSDELQLPNHSFNFKTKETNVMSPDLWTVYVLKSKAQTELDLRFTQAEVMYALSMLTRDPATPLNTVWSIQSILMHASTFSYATLSHCPKTTHMLLLVSKPNLQRKLAKGPRLDGFEFFRAPRLALIKQRVILYKSQIWRIAAMMCLGKWLAFWPD